MRFYSSTTVEETVNFLRDAAIRQDAGPLVIDAIDALRDAADLPEQLEKVEADLQDMEKARDDLAEELSTLIDAMESAIETLERIDADPDHADSCFEPRAIKEWNAKLSFAKKALERNA